ncbi:VWFA domain-containing protein [Planctomycetales bacterium 10988]|nr:VWFA domain-containing protein [Planctomycetales bacterium 10988]
MGPFAQLSPDIATDSAGELSDSLSSTAQETLRETFEYARIPTSPLEWLLLTLVVIGITLFVIFAYRRDCAESPGWLAVILVGLRLAALVGLLLVWLQPQARIERRIQEDSVAAIIVDTSLSMGMQDDPENPTYAPTRSEEIQEVLAKSPLVQQLRNRHDVIVATFGQDIHEVVRWKRDTGETSQPASSTEAEEGDTLPLELTPETMDWQATLDPKAPETRIGQALRQLISEHRQDRLVGAILFSDGQHNAGVGLAPAIRLAKEHEVKVHTVGVGSMRTPINLRVADLIAPSRAYPEDDFESSVFVVGQGLGQERVAVELYSQPADNIGVEPKLEGSRETVLQQDGEPVEVSFQLKAEGPGRRTLTAKVRPVQGDYNPRDDQMQADVEIVERRTRVLLFAGGPTREYRFLRNQLFRDKEFEVDVLLQTAQVGIAQEADHILDVFPNSATEMAEYDCVVAFDPEWDGPGITPAQIDLLEQWVAEQSGGLLVVAGPVYTEEWVNDTRMAKVRSLYPIQFSRHHALLDASRFENREPSPILLTQEGMEADFLWLEDNAVESRDAWHDFDGVFGFYGVREPKPAATVYARYQETENLPEDEQPIYFAGQFYGSGRVFYIGSGEMWRLRSLAVAYFERYYTKLLRHLSEGRLLRGSRRGVLLVERERYLLGQTVVVRAQLNDSQLRPLEVPSVPLEVVLPDGTLFPQVTLVPDQGDRPGMYTGQFVVREEGEYRLNLNVPEAGDEGLLSRRLQVRISDQERERPQLDRVRLQSLAEETGGTYVEGAAKAPELVELLPSRARIRYQKDRPEPLWDSPWIMGTICGLLCLEWLLRRCFKLA